MHWRGGEVNRTNHCECADSHVPIVPAPAPAPRGSLPSLPAFLSLRSPRHYSARAVCYVALFCQGRWLWAMRVLFRQNSLSSRRVASTAPQLFRKWELKRDLRGYAPHFRRKKNKPEARRWTDSPSLNQNWTQALVFSDPLTRRIPRGNNPSFKVCTENEAA